jgi:hypothetical protein
MTSMQSLPLSGGLRSDEAFALMAESLRGPLRFDFDGSNVRMPRPAIDPKYTIVAAGKSDDRALLLRWESAERSGYATLWPRPEGAENELVNALREKAADLLAMAFENELLSRNGMRTVFLTTGKSLPEPDQHAVAHALPRMNPASIERSKSVSNIVSKRLEQRALDDYTEQLIRGSRDISFWRFSGPIADAIYAVPPEHLFAGRPFLLLEDASVTYAIVHERIRQGDRQKLIQSILDLAIANSGRLPVTDVAMDSEGPISKKSELKPDECAGVLQTLMPRYPGDWLETLRAHVDTRARYLTEVSTTIENGDRIDLAQSLLGEMRPLDDDEAKTLPTLITALGELQQSPQGARTFVLTQTSMLLRHRSKVPFETNSNSDLAELGRGEKHTSESRRALRSVAR